MTTINVLLAMKESVAMSLRQDLRSIREIRQDETKGDATLTARQKKILQLFRAIGSDRPEKVTIGQNAYYLIDVVLGSKQVAEIDAEFPSAVVVAGAWLPNGLQFGQDFQVTTEPPQEGDQGPRERIDVIGTPVYPIHPRLIDFMPDDVEYNADGSEKSRKRPTKLKQVHKYLGWADRRWT